jgi:predicted ABC-type transport system involved in lysophospholipase L1 biosynthesis ATPase subunit
LPVSPRRTRDDPGRRTGSRGPLRQPHGAFPAAANGLIFQAFNLIPALTAEDNIRLPLLMDGAGNGGGLDEEVVGLLGLTAGLRTVPTPSAAASSNAWRSQRALATRPNVVSR